MKTRFNQSRQAAQKLATLSEDKKNQALMELAGLLKTQSAALQAANNKDLKREKGKISSYLFSRLSLGDRKVETLIEGLHDVKALPDPSGQVLFERILKPGLVLKKVSVPIGVIGVIFESRPDAVIQILSLMLKSGNACILKGGKEASATIGAFRKITESLEKRCSFLPRGWVQFLNSREEAREMLQSPDCIDLIVPRGSSKMVQSIMKSTSIPVLGHAEGICHIYVDECVNEPQAVETITHSKANYPAACNSLEVALIHQARAGTLLPRLREAALVRSIELRGCPRVRKIIRGVKPANARDWETEFSSLTLAVKVVDSMDEAIEHINMHGSHHTDSILSKDPARCVRFRSEVDSACVFSNVTTRYSDGFRFGFGAEVGISTARIHARGPVGLEGLVTYKYELIGSESVNTLFS